MIDWIIPDIPESLEVKIKRERYLAKEALAENHEVLIQGVASATRGTSSPGRSNTHTLFCSKKDFINPHKGSKV